MKIKLNLLWPNTITEGINDLKKEFKSLSRMEYFFGLLSLLDFPIIMLRFRLSAFIFRAIFSLPHSFSHPIRH